MTQGGSTGNRRTNLVVGPKERHELNERVGDGGGQGHRAGFNLAHIPLQGLQQLCVHCQNVGNRAEDELDVCSSKNLSAFVNSSAVVVS